MKDMCIYLHLNLSYKWRCTGEGNKLKLLLVLLSLKGLNICLFTIFTDVLVTTMKLSRPVGVFVVVVELEVVVIVWGDMRLQLPMRGCSDEDFFLLQIMMILPHTHNKYLYIYCHIAKTKTQHLLYLELFNVSKEYLIFSRGKQG